MAVWSWARSTGSSLPLTLGALLLGAAAWLWPVVAYYVPTDASTGPDPVSIRDYRADFEVADDGELTVEERITASFPQGRHGIFRFWDVVDPSDSGARLLPEDIEVLRDGRPEPTELSWQTSKRYRVAKIGDPDQYVAPGDHTYTIRYTIEGALGSVGSSEAIGEGGSWAEDDDRAMFYYNLVPGGWQMSIDRARLDVQLPASPESTACEAGWDGEYGCRVRAGRDGTVQVAAQGLPPRTPVTLQAALPSPPPERDTLPWPAPWDMSLSRSVPLLAGVVLVSLLLLVLGRVLARRAHEEPPGLPVTYAPPDGMGPVEAYYVVHERVPDDALAATLLHLAEQGLVRLEPLSKKQWRLIGTGTPEQWAGATPVGRAVGSELGLDQGGTFEADGSVASGKVLASARVDLGVAASDWARSQGFVVSARHERLLQALVVGMAWWPGSSRSPSWEPARCRSCRSRRSSWAACRCCAPASARGVRRPGARRGRARVASTGSCRRARPRRGSTSPPGGTCTRRTSPTPWASAVLRSGHASTSWRWARPPRSRTTTR